MGLFKSSVEQRSQREILTSRFQTARHNLLLVVIFSVVNILLLVINSGYYFLFSAFIPFMLMDTAMFECGLYPEELYFDYSNSQFADMSFMAICCVISAIILVLYLLSWIFSKKPRVGWLIFALVFFVIDTALLLIFVVDISEWILDIVFHIWVIISLSLGIFSYFKLKKIPQETESETITESVISQE